MRPALVGRTPGNDHGVSIHAPAWGATLYRFPRISMFRLFQSTHPRGVRQQQGHHHAHDASRFNPRTRVGCDIMGHQFFDNHIEFQSTHPRGVRRVYLSQLSAGRRVSIHAPAWGATSNISRSSLSILVFQSTHPRGVRRAMRTNRFRRFFVSIHAPAWGATCIDSHGCQCLICFNPRTRVGCDTR